MLQEGAVLARQDGKRHGAMVVLHHAQVVVALRQRRVCVDVEAIGVAWGWEQATKAF